MNANRNLCFHLLRARSLKFVSRFHARLFRRLQDLPPTRPVCQYQAANVSRKQASQFRSELRAVQKLLKNSGLLNKSDATFPFVFGHARTLHTNPVLRQEQNGRNNKDKDKDKEDEESKVSLLAKAAIWMMTAYIVITLMSLLFPTSNQPDVLRYVSWNEFYHHMLAKGEVGMHMRPFLTFS